VVVAGSVKSSTVPREASASMRRKRWRFQAAWRSSWKARVSMAPWGSSSLGERVEEGGEFLAFVVADDEVARGESVAEGVLGDARFAFGGARSGGMLGVGLVGGELGWLTYKGPLTRDASIAGGGFWGWRLEVIEGIETNYFLFVSTAKPRWPLQGHHLGLQWWDREELRKLLPAELEKHIPVGRRLTEKDRGVLLGRLESRWAQAAG
jgi:peptidoglycan/xylan/chitin deacetylase (PgdA/CDA1 family)